MRARISAISRVPNGRMAAARSVVTLDCRSVVASSLPYSMSLRTRSSRRPARLGSVVGAGVVAAVDMNQTRTQGGGQCKGIFSGALSSCALAGLVVLLSS
jgi:hypothetical protein